MSNHQHQELNDYFRFYYGTSIFVFIFVQILLLIIHNYRVNHSFYFAL